MSREASKLTGMVAIEEQVPSAVSDGLSICDHRRRTDSQPPPDTHKTKTNAKVEQRNHAIDPEHPQVCTRELRSSVHHGCRKKDNRPIGATYITASNKRMNTADPPCSTRTNGSAGSDGARPQDQRRLQTAEAATSTCGTLSCGKSEVVHVATSCDRKSGAGGRHARSAQHDVSPRRWMNHVHKPKSPNRRNHTSWPKHETSITVEILVKRRPPGMRQDLRTP